MAFSQTHSPFAFERERGSISRAAPVIQEAVRIERRKQKTRKIAFSVCGVLLAIGGSAFIIGERSSANPNMVTLAPAVIPEPTQLVQVESVTADNLHETLEFVSDLQTFVRIAEVNSVRLSGSSSKAIINGKLFHMGEVVAPSLGLKLVGYDSAGKFLFLRDAGGRKVSLPISQRQPS